MAAAAILKAVGHFRYCIFEFGSMSRTYSLNFMGFRRKLTGLLQFEFFHNFFIMAAAAILDLMIGDL
jgi:hypothetical protein